ncbi:MAG: polysaccharide deacetylase family protein [Terrimonas sp.]|nr:polysaccharide deacetylase family protein [Terrimonas sp.]
MFYLVKTPWWLKKVYPSYVWNMPPGEQDIYLTFDDGPHPEITTFVLQQLKAYDALASFFCIGKNVVNHPETYRDILDGGHSVGNHTHHHLNGWKTPNDIYLKDIAQAGQYIDSGLFRPPYGKISSFQAKHLAPVMRGRKPSIIMWDVLSADFDRAVKPEKCLENVIFNIKPGSIVVFHDSEKAFSRLSYALPRVLEHLKNKKYRMNSL